MGELEYPWIDLEKLDEVTAYPEVIRDGILRRASSFRFINDGRRAR
jgi:hypothetical protein